MTVDNLLQRFEGVRSRGPGRWTARCPSHDDRNPSLSISEGDRGLLVKCWAGCTLTEICAALGITPRQLFFDDTGPVDRDAIQRNQNRRRAAQARQRASGKRADAFREAEAVLRAATNLDISRWSNEQVDAALNSICDAHELLLQEGHHATKFERASA